VHNFIEVFSADFVVTMSVVKHNVIWFQIDLEKVLCLKLGKGIRYLEHQVSQYFLR
jgi:hypothetical protein